MRKLLLRGVKMNSAADYVDEAQKWAKSLVRSECRFPGDYSDAMRRIARHTKVPFGLLWRLHYRVPKTIPVDRYALLAEAWANEQCERYRAERRAAEPQTWLGKALVRAADFVAGEEGRLGDGNP
jgi:hypothetical protein